MGEMYGLARSERCSFQFLQEPQEVAIIFLILQFRKLGSAWNNELSKVPEIGQLWAKWQDCLSLQPMFFLCTLTDCS